VIILLPRVFDSETIRLKKSIEISKYFYDYEMPIFKETMLKELEEEQAAMRKQKIIDSINDKADSTKFTLTEYFNKFIK